MRDLMVAALFLASVGAAGAQTVDCTPHSYPQRTNQSLAVDPYNDGIAYVGVEGEGYFKTVDAGASWARIVHGVRSFDKRGGGQCYSEFFDTVIDLRNPEHVCFAMAGTPGTLEFMQSANQGVYCWVELPTGLVRGTRVTGIKVDPTNAAVIYASTFGLLSGGGNNYLDTQFGVLKSSDGGATWTSMKTGMGAEVRNQAIFRLDLSPRDPARRIVSVSDTSYFLSRDGAATFARPTAPSSQQGIMRFDPTDATGMRIVSLSQSGTQIVESRDGGNTWRQVGSLPAETRDNGDPSRPTGVRPSDIEISRQDARVMYLSGSHGSVYRTSDGGATWTKVLSGANLPQ